MGYLLLGLKNHQTAKTAKAAKAAKAKVPIYDDKAKKVLKIAAKVLDGPPYPDKAPPYHNKAVQAAMHHNKAVQAVPYHNEALQAAKAALGDKHGIDWLGPPVAMYDYENLEA